MTMITNEIQQSQALYFDSDNWVKQEDLNWQGRSFGQIHNSAALLIGINYFNTKGHRLKGGHQDVSRMSRLLTRFFNVLPIKTTKLTEHATKSELIPTKKNILRQLHELSARVDREGLKHLWVYYNGHGSYGLKPNAQGHEQVQEAIVPLDYKKEGFITDKDLREIFAPILRKGTRMTLVMDCSHSGGIPGLKYAYHHASKTFKKQKNAPFMPGSVLSFSACGPKEISGEIRPDKSSKRWTGALTWAFAKAVENRPNRATYRQLATAIQNSFKQVNIHQQMQIGCSKRLNSKQLFYSLWRGERQVRSF